MVFGGVKVETAANRYITWHENKEKYLNNHNS
jgi:hypothetical protein